LLNKALEREVSNLENLPEGVGVPRFARAARTFTGTYFTRVSGGRGETPPCKCLLTRAKRKRACVLIAFDDTLMPPFALAHECALMRALSFGLALAFGCAHVLWLAVKIFYKALFYFVMILTNKIKSIK